MPIFEGYVFFELFTLQIQFKLKTVLLILPYFWDFSWFFRLESKNNAEKKHNLPYLDDFFEMRISFGDFDDIIEGWI